MSQFDPEVAHALRLHNDPAPPLPEELGLPTVDDTYQLVHDFSHRVHDERAMLHPARTVAILHDFVADDVPHEAYQAALLHDVVNRYFEPNGLQVHNARLALESYFTKAPTDTRKYTGALLADMEIVEIAAETYRNNGVQDARIDAVLRGESAEVTPAYWMAKSSIVHPEVMLRLLEEVNLESVLIKAAEIVDNLHHPAPSNRAVLQDIFEAESFYAPLCEVLGYDGFAMNIRDAAASLRFRKSGNMLLLTEAQSVRDAVEELGSIEAVMASIFGSQFLKHDVIGGVSKHRVQIQEIVGELDGLQLAGVARTKSIGSIAMKMMRNGGETPVDIVGITFIAKDIVTASTFFKSLIRFAKSRPDIVQFTPAPSRNESLIIRGDAQFIGGCITDVLSVCEEEAVEIKPQLSGAFQVAKMTARVNGIPTEIGVQTAEDRRLSRIGDNASHIAFKHGNLEQHGLLGSIYDRKKRMINHANGSEVNGQSYQRGISLLRGLRII